jgi:hypothetical protein
MSEIWPIVHEHAIVFVGGTCLLLGMIIRSVTAVLTTATYERSRREISAYVAEGSMTPEDGERLLKAELRRGRPS